MFSSRAVEDEEITIARRLRYQFARLSIPCAIKKHWHLRAVPIVGIVGRRLKIPRHLACICIQSNKRARIKVIAFATLTRPYRLRIAGRHIDQVEIGIIGRGLPGHTAAMLA